MLRLYLARHGETLWNREARMQGHRDVPLSPLGVRQAEALANRLASVRLDAVWSSDLSRAVQTAEVVARSQSLKVQATPLLRESMLGDWEGLTEAEILGRGDAEMLALYRRDSIAHRPPGGETLEDVWARLLCARDEICRAHLAGSALVVGHGGSLRAIIADAIGAPLAGMRRLALDNASLSLVEYRSGEWRVRLLNDTSHLEGKCQAVEAVEPEG